MMVNVISLMFSYVQTKSVLHYNSLTVKKHFLLINLNLSIMISKVTPFWFNTPVCYSSVYIYLLKLESSEARCFR